MKQDIERKVNEEISRVRPFSHIVQSAVKLIDGGFFDNRELSNIINKDPVLMVKLLSLANSPFYGMRKEINNVEDACIVLGGGVVKNILISAGALACYPVTQQRKNIWSHSMAVAAVSELLAKKARQSQDNAYMAGLLHDVGKFLLLDLFPEYQDLIDSNHLLEGENSIDKETQVLGVNHAEVGATIIGEWNLPKEISSMVGNHHYQSESTDNIASSLLCMADEVCHKLEMDVEDDELVTGLKSNNIEILNINRNEINNMLPEIKLKIASLEGVLDQVN